MIATDCPGQLRTNRSGSWNSGGGRPAGWAQYGYCPSHSRWFWDLRLHLVALAGARAGEREMLPQVLGDKNYYGRDFEAALATAGITLLRPARSGEPPRPGARFLRPVRQVIESVFDTLKGQLDLERPGAITLAGVVAQRLPALTAAIWHNDRTGQPVARSLLAHDHLALE